MNRLFILALPTPSPQLSITKKPPNAVCSDEEIRLMIKLWSIRSLRKENSFSEMSLYGGLHYKKGEEENNNRHLFTMVT